MTLLHMPGEQGELHVRVEPPADVSEVLDFLRGTAYDGRRVDEDTIAVSPPESVDPPLARRELCLYLRILRRVRPHVGARILA